MRVTDESKALAQGILDYIISHPSRHNQADFIDMPGKYSELLQTGITEENICDTTMCIAGTAVYLTEGVEGVNRCKTDNSWESTAAPLLGLSWEEGQHLFFTMDNSIAVDMVVAIASGDEEKFNALYGQYEKEAYNESD